MSDEEAMNRLPASWPILAAYRHRMPVVVAVEPAPSPARMRWWAATAPSVAAAGAALVVVAPTPTAVPGAASAVDPELPLRAPEGPAAWILDAYLEPRARLDTAALGPEVAAQLGAWIEGIQHECPE